MMARKRSLGKKIFRIVLLLTVLLSGAVLTLAWFSGAWNVIFPSTQHDAHAPWIPTDLDFGGPSVLVFSKTNSFRHEEGIKAGNRVLREIALGKGWDLFASENGAVFNEKDLQRFDTVVFLNASGDMLSTAQEQVFQAWLEAGGGWVGIHAAGDGSHAGWRWYMDNLIGAKFSAHIMGPQFQIASVVLASPDHPIVQRLPNIWKHAEEWYSWEQSPRANGFNILAVLDEESYTPEQNFLGRKRDLRMGDHPVAWTNCVGEGRTFYAAMGHRAESFENTEFRVLLEDALNWTLGLTEGGCAENTGP